MHDWLYTLRERFVPEFGDRWENYLAFSGFEHIGELVTLDSIMCPNIVADLTDADWDYNVHEDNRTEFFRDPEYLMGRQPLDRSRHQLLAILEHPDDSDIAPSGFTRCGFDIMDSHFGNSTLTNCGPIPEAFAPSSVNEFGLLSDYKTAISVRDKMRQLRPDEPHLGNCEVWSIARRLPCGTPGS